MDTEVTADTYIDESTFMGKYCVVVKFWGLGPHCVRRLYRTFSAAIGLG